MIWYFLHIPLILLMAYLVRPGSGLQKIYWGGLFTKSLAGLCLGYVYFGWVGTGDTLSFHEEASLLYDLSRQSLREYFDVLFTPEYPVFKGEARNELFIRILSVFYLISGGSYWISAMYLSFISFLGTWYLVQSIAAVYPASVWAAAFAFLLFPSPVFWSSGVLKDPLINGSVFFLAGLCIRYYKDLPYKWWEILLTIVALHLLFYLRFYLYGLAIFTLGALLWFRVAHFLFSSIFMKSAISIVILIAGILMISRVNRNLNFSQLPAAVYQNYQTQIAHSDPENTLHFPTMEPDWTSLLAHIPRGIFAGLFRPHLFEGSLTHLIFGLENLLIFILFAMNLRYMKDLRLDTPGWLLLFYILILAAFLPLVAPNFGTLTRYKAAYIPFLVFLLVQIPYRRFLSKEG